MHRSSVGAGYASLYLWVRLSLDCWLNSDRCIVGCCEVTELKLMYRQLLRRPNSRRTSSHPLKYVADVAEEDGIVPPNELEDVGFILGEKEVLDV